MKPSRIQAVEHIHLTGPVGAEGRLRWFYTEIGKLDEVSTISSERWLLSFRSGGIEIRFEICTYPEIDPVFRRLTISVPSLWDAARRLEERGFAVSIHTGLISTDRRLGTLDPAGNRVDLKQEWPWAPL